MEEPCDDWVWQDGCGLGRHGRRHVAFEVVIWVP